MVENIYKLKNDIIVLVNKEMEGDKLDVEQLGMMVDMVKDLADAEKNCWEAEYYRSVTEAMGEAHARRGYGTNDKEHVKHEMRSMM